MHDREFAKVDLVDLVLVNQLKPSGALASSGIVSVCKSRSILEIQLVFAIRYKSKQIGQTLSTNKTHDTKTRCKTSSPKISSENMVFVLCLICHTKGKYTTKKKIIMHTFRK